MKNYKTVSRTCLNVNLYGSDNNKNYSIQDGDNYSNHHAFPWAPNHSIYNLPARICSCGGILQSVHCVCLTVRLCLDRIGFRTFPANRVNKCVRLPNNSSFL